MSKRGRHPRQPLALNAIKAKGDRMLVYEHTAKAVGEDSRPQKQDSACVPHAMDFSACCMSQEAPLAPALVPFVQAAARTCT